jgi:hypothetical protein
MSRQSSEVIDLKLGDLSVLIVVSPTMTRSVVHFTVDILARQGSKHAFVAVLKLEPGSSVSSTLDDKQALVQLLKEPQNTLLQARMGRIAFLHLCATFTIG